MSTRFTVLVVDSDDAFQAELEGTLKVEGFKVIKAGTFAEGRRLLDARSPDAAVIDLRLPDGSGLELLKEAGSRSEAPVLVSTAEYPDTREVVEAIRRGALDVLEKPAYPERIVTLLLPALEERRVEERRHRRATPPQPQLSRPPIIGSSPALKTVMDQVARVVLTPNTTVLIQGESGTGKELVARAIHFDGHRKRFPFMAINCAALNESILEAELFGYEKGSFTGANTGGKKGLFEAANGGTVFLDEIGEMSPGLQAKLLRVLQENTFKRVGGIQDVTMDIRIIAATNRDLWQEVEKGSFRKDLYFRLNVMPITMPPLRERRQDIPALVDFFLKRFAEAMRKPIHGISQEARRILEEHSWPGNIRELRNVCEYAAIVCDGKIVEPRHLALPEAPEVKEPTAERIMQGVEPDDAEALRKLPIKDWSLRSMEEELIRMVLAETRFNITRAARALGINRSTLYNKMRDYGLSRDNRQLLRSG